MPWKSRDDAWHYREKQKTGHWGALHSTNLYNTARELKAQRYKWKRQVRKALTIKDYNPNRAWNKAKHNIGKTRKRWYPATWGYKKTSKSAFRSRARNKWK